MRILCGISILVLSLFSAHATARAVENWSYERLFKESDVIVIASAQQTVRTDDTSSDERWKSILVGQQTTFSVIQTLKGQPGDGPLTVLHFKMKDSVVTMDGPMLIAFRTVGPKIEGDGLTKYKVELGTPHYLLFLKRTSGGRFEPVSGQVDSKSSVKEIYEPLPEIMDKR